MEVSYLSSDRAFDEFLRTRSAIKVRLEDPIRRRWSSRELKQHLYEDETERLRSIIRNRNTKESNK